ncbi:pyridoxal phosphate-dependent aminotransferase [Erwinia sp. S63]|uniref:MalY/PatB family protein n=1 Tax=Erwiniaceae TaxID=1903409 RepID=UPI001909AF81|nr:MULTISPECIES: MalY/PatB family protein [Erwiniaceae]MBK0099347.1 pyridoxal phosphate-dependent aminotransferase [Erwinia sp. S63]MBK0127337.1 pyridoxal phosphate-dependent aminotransferase [Pantoea sp. S61]
MSNPFDQEIIRSGTNSSKWDNYKGEDVIPLWIADMDFRVSPAIQNAVEKMAKLGVYGYSTVPDEYFKAITNWLNKRYYFKVKTEWILYTTGVLPALSAIIRGLLNPGDGIIIQEPVYNYFRSSIRNQGCRIINNALSFSSGRYEIDFDDLEHKAADNDTKALLLCNPHNPVGRAWTQDELSRVADICQRHNIIIISDEIHSDLVYEPKKHIPVAGLSSLISQMVVTCYSPSKGFNLAGLQVANIICENPEWRMKIDKAINIHETCDLNAFAADALIAAYNESEDWLELLKSYVQQNYKFITEFFSSQLPLLTVIPLEATYLAWVDCSRTGYSGDEFADLLEDKAGIIVNKGSIFGGVGNNFIRINLACNISQLRRALNRIKHVCKMNGI